MFRQKSFKLALLLIASLGFFTSCQKEDVLCPDKTVTDNSAVIFIRAIDRDSSVVESQQLLLR